MDAPANLRSFVCHFLAVSFCFAVSASSTPAPTNQSIPWAQLGASATAQYSGDGLGVIATPSGAQLRCVLQKLEGEVTAEGLSLSSIVHEARDQLQLTAARLGRDGGQSLVLDKQGAVQVVDAHARYVRPGLVEEFSVTADGIRQDFLVTQSPAGPGPLRLHLTLRGARAETSPDGAQLVLNESGRKLNYHRLRVTDATGRQLAAWMEMAGKSEIRNPKPKERLKVAAESADSHNEGKTPTAPPSPPGCGDLSLGENADRKTRIEGEGQTGTSRSLAVEGEGQTSSSATKLSAQSQTLRVLVEDTGALYPLRIDPTFSDANWISMGGFPGVNGLVRAAVVDSSGNLYIGGTFTIAGDVFATNIAKWNGTNWSALGSGIWGNPITGVNALAVSGSDLYAGGVFTNAGGNPANCIAKWDGSNWTALGSGVNNSVFALAVSGSDLYAGGTFWQAGGNPARSIAKWDGSSWSALGSGMSGTVYALAVSGNELYVGGAFPFAGGSPANRVAKWDGTSWSAVGSGMDNAVYALAVSASDLYAGGDFRTAGGSPANRVAKWDGNSWTALGLGMNAAVNALAVSGNDLYVGGLFSTADGNSARNIAKWNGGSWSTLGSGMRRTDNLAPNVLALTVSGGDLYVGGNFMTAGGSPADYIAKWNGSSWNSFNDSVACLAVLGNDLYVGGAFTTAGEIPANQIAKWNGTNWSALGLGLGGGDDFNRPVVYALAVSGSDVYAGGYFTTAGGIPANSIAKWNGTGWSALGSGINAYVLALAVSGTRLYAGGYFTMAGVSPATNIARWNGSFWSALGSGMIGDPYYTTVRALAVSGSDLYVGGAFTNAGGSLVNRIAKWDGSTWSALGSGMRGYVASLAVLGSDLYAGGGFTNAGGSSANRIAKWDGSTWSPLGLGMNGTVYGLAISGSDLYAGGYFTMAGGSPATNIARWNGSSWSALGSGMNNWVAALVLSGGDLYAGGSFTRAGGKVSPYFAKARIVSAAESITASASSATIQFSGVVGYEYHVQRTGSLTPPMTWTTLTTTPLSPADDGSLTFTDTTAPPGVAYYRLLQN